MLLAPLNGPKPVAAGGTTVFDPCDGTLPNKNGPVGAGGMLFIVLLPNNCGVFVFPNRGAAGSVAVLGGSATALPNKGVADGAKDDVVGAVASIEELLIGWIEWCAVGGGMDCVV